MKTVNLLITIAYYGLLVTAFFIFKMSEDISRLAYLLLASIMPLILPLIAKVMRFRYSPYLTFIYLLFTMASMIFGNIYSFYRFTYFDTILHMTSGAIIAFLIYDVYCLLKKTTAINSREELVITLLFVEGVNMLVAFLWEVFEFALLVFFDNDAINHYTEGVYDTMIDMIVCFLGSLPILVFIFDYYRSKHKNVVIKATDNFITINRR